METIDTVRSESGREWSANELAQLLQEQHAEISRLDVLLVVKDQTIAQLQAELVAARSPMDPYAVACEIASKQSPSNDDMRRLRAAEVAIAYCGRAKRTEAIQGNYYAPGLAARMQDAQEREAGRIERGFARVEQAAQARADARWGKTIEPGTPDDAA